MEKITAQGMTLELEIEYVVSKDEFIYKFNDENLARTLNRDEVDDLMGKNYECKPTRVGLTLLRNRINHDHAERLRKMTPLDRALYSIQTIESWHTEPRVKDIVPILKCIVEHLAIDKLK